MRIAIFSTCPAGVYSGGRYHALIAGYCLARRGHEIYFITDNEPVFDADLRPISPGNPVRILTVASFNALSPERMDAVFIAPQLNKVRRLYNMAMRTAERDRAALILFCFETPNWFNEVSPHKRPEAGWREWQLPVRRGALVLCSAEESRRYAEAYFTGAPPETRFDVWQPAINSPALHESDAIEHQKKILLFARPSDKHKGSDVVEQLMVPELADHTFSIIIGNPRGAGAYRSRISALAVERGLSVEFLFSLSDEAKFAAIKAASAMVFPSFFEGYGYPPVEALACDTACVAYDLPVIRENVGDLIRYAPAGDVAALRAALIATVRQPRSLTAGLPQVRFLTDIDQRAEALERVIERHLEHLARPKTLATIAIGNAQSFIFGDRQVIHFTLAADTRILSALSSAAWLRSCWVDAGYWHDGRLLHTVILSGKVREAKDLTGTVLYLGLAGGASAEVALNISAVPSGQLTDIPEDVFGISQVTPAGAARLVSAWAMPAPGVEYDAVVWLARQGEALRCVVGDTAHVNPDYKAKTGISEQSDCGLLFQFDREADMAGQNAVILLRNGEIVAAGRIPAAMLPNIREGESALMARDISGGLPAPRLKISATDTRAETGQAGFFAAVAEAGDEACVLDIYRQPFWLGLPIGNPQLYATVIADRANTEARPEGGTFRLLLPAIDPKRFRYSLRLRTRRGDVSQSVTPVLAVAPDVVRFMATSLCLSVEETVTNAVFTVIKRPLQNAVSVFVYDAQQKRLNINGWVLTEDALRVELLDGSSGEAVAATTERTERADVAKRHADGTFIDYGFEISLRVGENAEPPASETEAESVVSRLGEAGYSLRITTGAGHKAERFLGLPSLTGVTEFTAFDTRYDSAWDLLWIRGVFAASGHRLSSIEAWQGERLMGEGAVNIKQFRHGETNTGWRFELLLDEPLDAGLPIDIRATLENGGRVELVLPAPVAEAGSPAISPPYSDLIRYGAAASQARLLSVLPPPERPRVLLIIHNLDAVDRPEKAHAIQSLRDELRLQGRELVVLHHSHHAIPNDVAEINFFDGALDGLARMAWESDPAAMALFPPAARQRAAGALYGFYSTLNLSPVAMERCLDQIDDEVRKVLYVMQQVKPDLVLLWHQWNSLMEVGRTLANALSVPSAYLHEGMIPKTLTLDAQGMMAEAGCVGVTLKDTPANASWLEKADAVIAEIRDKRLDRKPQSGLSVMGSLRDRADAMGARLVFYAGINDWHSGNLPRDGRAQLHSPVFEDTQDGLDALAALAEANNWLILFKPHPNLYPQTAHPHPRVVVVRESNVLDCLLLSDVTVTILSSVAYIALANDRPVVLMGRNTLSGSGSVYEVTGRAMLEQTLNAALARTGFDDHRQAFRRHIAALLKDYLYAYDPKDTLAVKSQTEMVDMMKKMAGTPVGNGALETTS